AFKENAKFDKAATVQFLKDSVEFCTKALNQTTEDQLHAVSGPSGRQMIGFERLWAYFTHTAHHRGQAEVYMRVKNVKPPLYKF
ncbi:MAG TPA: DinB family protein, partial [Bryobacteraceae bacterium]|nr:DinB family protein [Bryobacteraceae bacterium]